VDESEVYIVTENQSSVSNTLTGEGVSLTHVHFINEPTNSVWIRDYGPNNVYTDDIESLLFVDWIYNRPSRPDDDASPDAVSTTLSVPLYETTQAPTDLVNTGGNFFSDGFGTAFASELILEENESGNPYGVTAKTEDNIDTIMKHFMGIERFIKFPVLPYDGIHHIDMHMKMLDEETILLAQYPPDTADGPQIELNLQYLQNNFNSVFGTPYRIVRIPSPPSISGLYPDNGGYYRTYTNSLIINKTIIIPTYREEYDTIAMRIYREAMPGYKLVGIDCDYSGGPISASGAIHCITHEIGSDDPLLISHQRLEDTDNIWTPYQVDARIMHNTGISSAYVYYTTDTLQPYQPVSMTLTNSLTNKWTGFIPNQVSGTTVYYYIEATANGGKTLARPMPAPDGWWRFNVYNPTNAEIFDSALLKFNSWQQDQSIFIDIFSDTFFNGTISIKDVTGKQLMTIYNGEIVKGKNQFIINSANISAGMYIITVENDQAIISNKILIK
jgi:agmatine/peptidylarginine deiminase